jgi:hypothetical protein
MELQIETPMPPRLGDITASSATDEDFLLLTGVTDLSERTVRRRCGEVHGNTLLRNLFDREWPHEAEDLAQCTVALARDAGLALEIAEAAGLSERTVSKRLVEAAGQTLVGTLIPELFDEDDEGDDEEDEDEESSDDATIAKRLGVDDQWSRPRMIARIIEILGEEAPERLRAARFQELIALLATEGIEACLVDDPDEAVLTPHDESPGIASKLRLRLTRGRPPGGGRRELRAQGTADGGQRVMAPADESPAPGAPLRSGAGPSALGPGAIVGSHYLIVRAMGDRGGFGKVFEVKDESRPDRDFVMKVADGATAEERAVNEERLREEVKIAHRVTHQNTCAYLEDRLDPTFGVFYAIMKHAGVSLQRLLHDAHSFELADAIEIAAQVAEGLDYAHNKKGVIHQDVKPANVLVQGEPGNREVRIGDWGIARRGRDTRRADGSPTVVATVLGMSPGYVAPEQWRGEARSASDQYCLALVFCSLLEGRVFTEHYKFRSLAPLTVDQNMAVQRALSYEPEDRFGSCRQFVAKLREG